jgi:hypothetical protein
MYKWSQQGLSIIKRVEVEGNKRIGSLDDKIKE